MRDLKVAMLIMGALYISANAQQYRIDWYVIPSGGGHGESEIYQADGSIGQPLVGRSSSPSYVLEAGFWVGFGSPSPDCRYIPGDVNFNGTPLELADVVTMIANYRGSSDAAYTCDCPPNGPEFAATADPDGSCVSLELNDVVTEIGGYRGTAETSGCPDCPGSLRLIPGGNNDLLVIPTLKKKIDGKRATMRK